MEQQVKVANRIYLVDYEKADGELRITVDGRRYRVDSAALAGGFFSLFVNDRVHDLFVWRERDSCEVVVKGRSFPVDFFDPRTRQVATAAKSGATGTRQVIRAPMAGRIVRIQQAVGDMVQDGEGLVVLEAMKMENELKSQGIGGVKEILVAVNDVVAPGQQLMIIE